MTGASSASTSTIGRRFYDRTTALIGGLINLISPRRASNYVAGRLGYREFVAGSIKGVDKKFNPRQTSGDADVKRALKVATARCRDQAENNPLISGALERIGNNVIRGGIYPKFKFKLADGKLDTETNKRWRQLHRGWIRHCDVTGHNWLPGLQRLVLRHLWIDGGCLIHRIYDTSLKGIVPLRLELLELDMLDPQVDGPLPNGNTSRRGIEFDAYGREAAFHLLDSHPGDYLSAGRRMSSTRIPASEIIHVWDRRRISQFSGIGWLVAVVMEAYRMDEFRHITQNAARLQSVFFAFLESAYPGFSLGGGLPLGGQASFPPGDTGTTEAPRELTDGILQKIPPGTRVNMSGPVQPGNNYEPFVKDSQRWQASGVGMSFEAYSSNYTDASYASARSGSLEERLSYRNQQQIIDAKCNCRLMQWFMDAAWLSGLAPAAMPRYATEPHLYHDMVDGQFPGWGWVDPGNDARAAETRIDLLIDTRHNAAGQSGLDWDEVFDEAIDEEEKMLKIAEIRSKRRELEGTNNNGDQTSGD